LIELPVFYDVLRAIESMKVREVVVGITDGLWAGLHRNRECFDSWRRWGICLFTKALRMLSGSQPQTHLLLWVPFPGIRWPRH